MSEDNGQDRKDKESDDSVAKHLAEKRRALDLRTRPMEVIDDLDWDIPDFDDDDDDFAAPAPAAEATPEPEPAPADNSPRERQKRVSSGTMMMSASAFKDAMDDESPGDESDADAAEQVADAAPQRSVDTQPVEEEPRVARSAGGTMMMSTEGLEAVSDDDASAERHREASREWQKEDMEAADEADSDDASPGARGAGGTMLISGKALAEEMEKQSDESAEATPYEQMADEAEERHQAAAEQSASAVESSAAAAREAVTTMEDGLDNTDPHRRDVPRAKGQGLLYGAVVALGIGILVLVWMLFFR